MLCEMYGSRRQQWTLKLISKRHYTWKRLVYEVVTFTSISSGGGMPGPSGGCELPAGISFRPPCCVAFPGPRADLQDRLVRFHTPRLDPKPRADQTHMWQ